MISFTSRTPVLDHIGQTQILEDVLICLMTKTFQPVRFRHEIFRQFDDPKTIVVEIYVEDHYSINQIHPIQILCYHEIEKSNE